MSLAIPVFDRTRQGELLSRIEGDSGAIGGILPRRLTLIPDAARAVVVLILILAMSWRLTAVQLLVLPAMLVSAELFGAALRKRGSANRRLMDRYMTYVQETTAGTREIKTLQLEGDRVERFVALAGQAVKSSLGLGILDAYAGLANLVIGGLGSVAVIGFAAWQIVGGHLTVGQLVAFTAYAGQLAGSLESLAGFRRSRQELLVSIERAFGLMDGASEPVDLSPSVPMPDLSGQLSLEGVSFAYDAPKPVLEDITCRLEPGRVTGIAGLSGSGKTTLFNLLLRFYTPMSGTIRLDGRDIQDYDLAVLRRAISVVPQEPFFFKASIRENLLYANPEATTQDIDRACALVGAGTFISRLPQGLDTVLGDRGVGLSGDERQRLALARAILRESRVILCDEVTAALDAEAEKTVSQALRTMASNRTVVVVAHRPSTMRQADHVIVLHDGRVVAEGPHELLLSSSPVYRRLYEVEKERRA